MKARHTDDLFNPLAKPFNAAPAVVQANMEAESDGGVVCELRRVYRELDMVGASIKRDWPESAAKQARLERNEWMKKVIAEAGRRLKARVCKTQDTPGPEGF